MKSTTAIGTWFEIPVEMGTGDPLARELEAMSVDSKDSLVGPYSDISDDSAYVPCQSSMRHRQAALRKLIERVDVALAVPGDQVLEMGSYNQPEAELQSVFNRHWFHGGIMIVGAAIVTALTVYYLPSGLLPFRVSVI